MKRAALLMILALGACGADGAPERPTLDASVGVDSNGRVRTNAGVGARLGPLGVRVGL